MHLVSMTNGVRASSNKAWGYVKDAFHRYKSAVAVMALMAAAPSVAHAAEDLLASGKEDVIATFGADSLVAMCIVLAEVIVGVGMYIKTKNLMLLLGLVVVIIFTTIGYSYVS